MYFPIYTHFIGVVWIVHLYISTDGPTINKLSVDMQLLAKVRVRVKVRIMVMLMVKFRVRIRVRVMFRAKLRVS
jgi:hypothetical protein